MSPVSIRLATAIGFGLLLLGSPLPAQASGDSVWAPLGPLPRPAGGPIFALAAESGGTVLVGTAAGEVYRSSDGGSTWNEVLRVRGAVLTLSFSPVTAGTVLAGTREDGVWSSSDDGKHWIDSGFPKSISVRGFAFAKSLTVAATDAGAYVSRGSWIASGLSATKMGSVAALMVNDPAQFVAGGDLLISGQPIPLYQAQDSGGGPLVWQSLKSPDAATTGIAALAAGPVKGAGRPILMGTGNGAFVSTDSGTTWTTLAGIPATDFNVVAFGTKPDHFYLGSDAGGSESGGLWETADSGQTFRSMEPPIPSVSALALTPDDSPTLYVATFRAQDQAAMLWSVKDTGVVPSPPVGGVPAVATPPVATPARNAGSDNPILRRLEGPEGPYLVLGGLGLLILLIAAISQLRRRPG